MTTPSDYRYRELIERYLDWNRVQERLTRYSHIRECFPIEFLRSRSMEPPYYSHFLAWRLGVWPSEDRFQYLDDLLAHAMSLTNWTKAKCTSYSPEYEQFFSLVWELQIAKFLALQPNFVVSWMETGPDLQVQVDNHICYVECYNYRKSFGIELFIEDVLTQVHQDIRVKHGRNLIFSLPRQGRELSEFLEQVLSPMLQEQYLQEHLNLAELNWPVTMPIPNGAKNFFIYIDGDSPETFDTQTPVPYSTGDPESYLHVSIREAVNHKRNANKISENRPNLLAVNFLMSADFQLALHHSQYFGQMVPLADFGAQFDGFLFAVCGINSDPKHNNCILQLARPTPWILEVLENTMQT